MMTEKKNKKIFNIFPVPIQTTLLELNIDSLIEFCYEMKRKNDRGVEGEWQKRAIYHDKVWQSNNIINDTNIEFVKLKTEIEDAVTVYHEEMGFKKTFEQKIDNIWANINQKESSMKWHIHTGAFFSGVFYLTKSKTPIVFRHPFHDIVDWWSPSIIEEWNVANSGEWRIEPKSNALIIFPSWLEHRVQKNEEDSDRISFSFNTRVPEDEEQEFILKVRQLENSAWEKISSSIHPDIHYH